MCGYAVAWSRSEFRSKWRLDPDSSVLTEGRYYRVSESTPFYPGIHMLGNRTWTSDERTPNGMGEWAGPRYTDKSGPPLVPPAFIQIGTSRCIERGGASEDVPLTYDELGTDSYLPVGCYGDPVRTMNLVAFGCPRIAWFAFIMKLVFDGNWQDYLDNVNLPGYVSQSFREEADSVFSHFGIVVRGDECQIFIDGTRNEAQLLAQAYYGVFGPSDYGSFDANALYHANAIRVLRKATEMGAGDCTKFIFIGHSYGGATAAVAAAIVRGEKPLADIAVLTFGAPRAGGAKLRDALRAMSTRHFRRPLDPIPFLPPQYASNFDFFSVVFNLIAIESWIAWGLYSDYENSHILESDGVIGGPNLDPPSSSLMSTIMLQIHANTPLGSYAEHAMSIYSTEMALHCGLTLPT